MVKIHYFDEIVNIIEKLRAPGGCPWDRKQTLETLRKPVTEEAYELAEAITKNDMQNIKEEAGDLLLQVVFIASIANEKGEFNMSDVVRAVCDKLIRRHPHVFGNVKAETSEEVLKNWEAIKTQERKSKNQDLSILAGVPDSLPPLLKADRMQAKAAHVGFDWPGENSEPLFKKIDEELNELKDAVKENNIEHMSEELGDVLFVIVNLARRLKIDADAALSKTCSKFKSRFSLMEQYAREENREISEYDLNELDKLWDKAKESLRNNQV